MGTKRCPTIGISEEMAEAFHRPAVEQTQSDFLQGGGGMCTTRYTVGRPTQSSHVSDIFPSTALQPKAMSIAVCPAQSTRSQMSRGLWGLCRRPCNVGQFSGVSTCQKMWRCWGPNATQTNLMRATRNEHARTIKFELGIGRLHPHEDVASSHWHDEQITSLGKQKCHALWQVKALWRSSVQRAKTQ